MAHIGNKTRKLDIAASPICVDKERERCVCGCCAAAENPYSVCWPIEKNNHVDGSLKGLKSHAYHILMQQILPLCVCTIMRKEVCICIIRLSRVFKRLCAKTINPLEMNDLRKDTAIILCMVEKKILQAFFDVMTHLLVHLVEELDICGPVHVRCMYPMERYLKTLKGYVRNRARSEASMAEGHVIDEVFGFCTEYMPSYTVTSRRVWDDKGPYNERRNTRRRWATNDIYTKYTRLDTRIYDQ